MDGREFSTGPTGQNQTFFIVYCLTFQNVSVYIAVTVGWCSGCLEASGAQGPT